MSSDSYRSTSSDDDPASSRTQVLDFSERRSGATTLGYPVPDLDDGPSPTRHVIDRFDGALGLLVLRLVTAAVVGIHGLQKLQHVDATTQTFREAEVPSANTLALVVPGLEIAIGIALVLGLAVRFAGLALVIVAAGTLVLLRWRSGQVFASGMPGFTGELDLLLAAVGLTFLGVGGGGWGLDRTFRNRRNRRSGSSRGRRSPGSQLTR